MRLGVQLSTGVLALVVVGVSVRPPRGLVLRGATERPAERAAEPAPRRAAAPRAAGGARAALDAAPKPTDVHRCLRSRWIVFVGDSVTRGIFFDLLDLAAGTRRAELRAAPHAGHAADFSDGCLQTRRAGAYNRTRCAMWDYALCPPADRASDGAPPERARRALGGRRWRVCVPADGASCRGSARAPRAAPAADADAPCGSVRAPAPATAACPGGARAALRLTYYAKAYADEPCVDAPLVDALARARAPPDALVVGVGLWDMLYARERGAAPFGAAVRALLARLRAAGVRAPVAWLEVTAVAERALPPFKRGVMSTAAAAALNARAAPALHADGAAVAVPLFEPTRAAPELSADGVHYPRLLELAARTLHALCAPRARRRRGRQA
ncbi:hypothetical protein KFE25_013248 [Diacronema lutheri]|uniref:SGNH hydrolase-type esterase domain-containing protein n=1 Tax=Diacronema lutheri TaxID=2081491 RepID=A0A8J5XBP2_DIALT|nr:hypothetical protein KFE25_013248 [Diacronema lutheri]